MVSDRVVDGVILVIRTRVAVRVRVWAITDETILSKLYRLQ